MWPGRKEGKSKL
jgi:hypothetical protein